MRTGVRGTSPRIAPPTFWHVLYTIHEAQIIKPEKTPLAKYNEPEKIYKKNEIKF